MPDVGLLDSTEPVPPDTPVIIRFSVEVGGLQVYNESYDVDKLRQELARDEPTTVRNWIRRLKCVVGCRDRHGFSACVTRCLTDGRCCAEGHRDCRPVDGSEG